jgi:hypothetical protein
LAHPAKSTAHYANILHAVLESSKTNATTFITKNTIFIKHWVYDKRVLRRVSKFKILGLQMWSHLQWANHIGQFAARPSRVCYTVRSLLRISNTVTLKPIYFACFHSVMNCAIIVCVTRLTAKIYLRCKRKLPESGWVSNPIINVQPYWRGHRSELFHVNIYIYIH